MTNNNNQAVLPGAEVVAGMSDDELRQLVKDMSALGLSRNRIADEAGYTPSALSGWMNKKYTAKDQTVFVGALKAAMERLLEKRFSVGNTTGKKFARQETSVTLAVFEAAKICQFRGLMGLFTGRGGLGKTTAAEMYAASAPNVAYVWTSKFMTKRQLREKIAEQCGVREFSSFGMLEKVCEKLKSQKSLVIIDESENLSLDVLDTVRQINDQSGAGLLFIGQEPFYELLAKSRRTHEYLVDRFKARSRVTGIGLSDVRLLAGTVLRDIEGIEKVLLAACNGSARFLESLVFKLDDLVREGAELDERLVLQTADAVRIF